MSSNDNSDILRIFPYNFKQDEELAALLGSIAASWAGIEFQLSHLFTWLMGCSPLHGPAAYFRLQNAKARSDMMRGLSHLLFDDEEKETVRQTLDECQQAADIRNRWLHSPYMKEGGTVFQLREIGRRFPHGFKHPVSQKEVWDDAAAIAKTSAKLGETITSLTKKRPLLFRRETVPQSLQQKFHELFGFEMTEIPPTTSDRGQ